MKTNIVNFRGRSIKVMSPVKVYRNLHKSKANDGGGPVYSVMQDGLVVAHGTGIALTDVIFVVNAAGRSRVLKERRKNVHAFVTGYVVKESPPLTLRASYNPYKADTFTLAPGFSIHACKTAYVGPEGVLIGLDNLTNQ